MRFETFHLLSSPAMEPAATLYANTFAQIRLADEMGFDCAWFAEHHFSNYAIVPNPLLPAVKAATLTKRIRFGQAVLVTPLWHPLRLAMDVALADVLTDGRLNVGLGRGYSQTEFTAFGASIEDNREQLGECLDLIRRAWTEDDFTHSGRLYQVPKPITALPRPVQQPYPPLHIAASHADSVAWVARQGYALLSSGQFLTHEAAAEVSGHFRRAWREAGRPEADARHHLLRFVHVAPSDGEAMAQIGETRWLNRVSRTHSGGTARVKGGVNQVVIPPDEIDDAEWAKRLVFGGPETVIATLRRLEAAGITHVICHFDIAGMAQPTVRRSMELFAERVMPAFAAGASRAVA